MREIGAYEAKTHLSALLDRVDHGESFAITKHGRVVAFLMPVVQGPSAELDVVISGMRALRKKIAKRKTQLTLQELNQMKQRGRQ